MSSPGGSPAPNWEVVLEIREEPCKDRNMGFRQHEREQFRQNVLGNLEREFAGRLKIVYVDAPREEVVIPRLTLDGERLEGCRSLGGAYLTWSMLRLQIAARLAQLTSLHSLIEDAERDLERYDLQADTWADGLLEWALRRQDTPPEA